MTIACTVQLLQQEFPTLEQLTPKVASQSNVEEEDVRTDGSRANHPPKRRHTAHESAETSTTLDKSLSDPGSNEWICKLPQSAS